MAERAKFEPGLSGARIAHYDAFWPYYLGAHRQPGTQLLHALGTVAALATALLAIWRGSWQLLILAPLLAYACAWSGHYFIEHNRPATFRYPLWSLRADAAMFRLWLTGRLKDEIARYYPEDL